jgi:hypothetical protein
LDFAKAFDTIEHGPILEIMKVIGFLDKWLHWINMIFNLDYSSILLNGVPGKHLCKRGVRQGDPLSPLLFVPATELLQYVIKAALSLWTPANAHSTLNQ